MSVYHFNGNIIFKEIFVNNKYILIYLSTNFKIILFLKIFKVCDNIIAKTLVEVGDSHGFRNLALRPLLNYLAS